MNEIIVIIIIPIFLTVLWWVFIKKSKTFLSDKPKELLLGLSTVLVLIEVFAIWARFIAPQYVVIEINGDEIYRTWNYEKALNVYYAEREKRYSSKIILFDEDWGNSLWEDIDPKDIYANERYDRDNLDLDSLVLTIFPNADSYAKEISRIGFKTVFSSYSEDGKARLFSVHCGGTMCSGTSYILYKKDDGSCALKKIAYMKPAEEGGMHCPTLYSKIQDCEHGYYALGRFSFSSTDSVFQDTMFVSKEFLESKQFCLDWTDK